MKKLMSMCTAIALFAMVVTPAFAQLNNTVTIGVGTGLTQDTTGGATPIVKAKWEMNIAKDGSDKYLGTDDDMLTAGAQFMPSGVKDTSKRITLCSIVTDPDGLADIKHVYADVFYPENVELGNSHVALTDQSGLGCGELMQEDELARLSKVDGIALFCNNIRNNNTALPTFNAPYTYEEICKADGELQKETAAVYCGEKDLSYEDPSGSYKVWAVGADKVGLMGTLENYFTYLPLTAFETDFTAINYGNVRVDTHKIINGDLTWGASLASVRNIGNTRTVISIKQDDMGFGKTNGNWNVQYDARIGSDAVFAVYSPEQTVVLDDELDLSELDEMDFSIEVFKFPPTHVGDYSGTMTLTAGYIEHLTCGEPQPSTLTVNKIVIGGDKQVSDFPLFVDGVPVTSGVATVTLPGSHTVTETSDANYGAVFSGNCNSSGIVNVPVNGSAACTITNTFNPTCGDGIVNQTSEECDDGNEVSGDGCENDCTLTPPPVTCGDGKVNQTSEQCDDGNTIQGDGCDNGCLTSGTLTVIKQVINDNGGLLTVGSFTLKIDGSTITSGVSKTVAPGSHTASEDGIFGYASAVTGDCNPAGIVNVASGENKTCTITNNDIAPSIQLIKNVVGGTADPDDFDLTVDGSIISSGSSVSVMANVPHSINEAVIVPGYSFTSILGTSFKGVACPTVLNGTITLLPGDVVTCTITNTLGN